jgi:hypothetical protein
LASRLTASQQRAVGWNRERIEAPGEHGGPTGERPAVGLGDPEQVPDDRLRQRRRQVVDDVEGAHPGRPRDQRLGVRFDLRSECRHSTRRERVERGLAEPGMVRRVPEQHRLAATGCLEGLGVTRGCPVGHEVPLEPFPPEPRVTEDRRDVCVAAEHPEAVRRSVDRRDHAEARIDGIGIGRRRTVEEGRHGRLRRGAGGGATRVRQAVGVRDHGDSQGNPGATGLIAAQ